MTGPALLGGFEEAYLDPGAWEELPACPICASPATLADVGIVEGEQRGPVLAVCLECEHGFLRRRPRATWFDDFYARQWDSRGRERKGGFQTRPSTKVADFVGDGLPAGGTVLDVGAGFGAQLLGFRARGFAVRGLERSAHRAAYIRDRLDIPCICAPLESAGLPDESADGVFSHHVLEHVSDPDRVIAHKAAMLAPSGLIYVAVPNLWQEYPPQSLHFVPHLSLFTRRSLTLLLARRGFRVVKQQEDRELQFLAEPAGASAIPNIPPATDESRETFRRRVASWLHESFGDEGRRTLAWWKAKDRRLYYERRFLPAAKAAMVRRARGLDARLPKQAAIALHRVLPNYARGDALRMLPVAVSPDPHELPLAVRHEGTVPPVWIK